MKLVVHELKSTFLEQEMCVGNANVSVIAIRPHIYKHNTATGALQVQIYDEAGMTQIAVSETINISAVSTSPYFHGYIRFYINAYLQKNTNYRVRLVGLSGYSFNESAYCGWCNGYDLAKYEANPIAANLISFPLDLEVWQKREA